MPPPDEGLRPLLPTDPLQLGPYAVSGVLGSGGMGRVYLGRDPAGRPVAIKVIRAMGGDMEDYLERFRNEAESARRVARLFTAEVLDFDVGSDLPYIVTEYVEGPTLAKRVREGGPVTGSELDQLAFAIAGALSAVHRVGLVHRDLKPENVILSPTGPRVIDFGVARTLDSTVTHGMTVIGTPGYMAPEQILGEETTRKADVFAWGATVAFAGLARNPFGDGGYHERTRRTLETEPDIDRLELPLRSIVGRALHKAPENRPTAQELSDMLVGASERGVGPDGTVDLAADSVTPGTARAFEIEQRVLRRLGF